MSLVRASDWGARLAARPWAVGRGEGEAVLGAGATCAGCRGEPGRGGEVE